MRIICAALMSLLVAVSAALHAQTPGKVSAADLHPWEGAWVLDVARSGLTPAESERRVMTVGPTWLRVDLHRPRDEQPAALIYNLDGSTNVNAFGSSTAVTKLSRDGEYVVLETCLLYTSDAADERSSVDLGGRRIIKKKKKKKKTK